MYQQNKKSSHRNYQKIRVNSKVPLLEKSTSPSINLRQQITPKRKQQFSLPKFDITNNYLQQPVTREHMLKFLEQIVFAVENVQCILSQSDNVQNQITQKVAQQQNNFQITQEQQTDHSFIQQQLQSKFKFVNKKTQTPNRTQSYYQNSELKNLKATKLKTEFSEESDSSEKQSFKLPNISQQSTRVKQKMNKILPDGTKNRIQSQIIQYQYYKNQKDNKNMQSQYIQGFHLESQSDLSNQFNESSQQIRIIKEQSDNQQVSIISKKSKINLDAETQKKQNNNILMNDQSLLNKTRKVHNDVLNIQQQQQNQSKISKTSNELMDMNIKQEDPQTSYEKNNNSQTNSIQQENYQNQEIKQKIKKRPIHLKKTNEINNDSLQIDKQLSINQNDNSKIQEQNPSNQINEQYKSSSINEQQQSNINENMDDNKKQDNQAQINLSQQSQIDNESKSHQIQDIQVKNPITVEQNSFSIRQSQNNNKTIENEEFYYEPEEENKVISKLQPKTNLQDQHQLLNKTSSTVKSVYVLKQEEITEKGNLEMAQELQDQENLNNNKDTQQLLQIEYENMQNQISKKNSIDENLDQKSEKTILQIKIKNDLIKSLQLVKQQGEFNDKPKSLQQSQIYANNDLNKQLTLKPTDQIKGNENKKIIDIKQTKENQNIEGNHQLGLNEFQNNENENQQQMLKQESLNDQNNTIKIPQDQLKQIKSSDNLETQNNYDLIQSKSQGLSNRSMMQSQKINFPKETQEMDSNLKIT